VFSQSPFEWTDVEIVRVTIRRHELGPEVFTALLECPAHLSVGVCREEASDENYDHFLIHCDLVAIVILEFELGFQSLAAAGVAVQQWFF
jgi:hypothetical protein